MLGRRLINTGAVACTTDTVQILDAGKTQSIALYRFEDNANDTAYTAGSIVSSNRVIDLDVNGYSSGTTITDSTSNYNNATIVGNVTYSNPSGSNGRFNLDGASDYLQIGASATFNSAANFTVEGWFKPDNITDLDHFFTIWDGGSNSKLYLRFTGTSGDLNGYTYTSGGSTSANLSTSNAAVRVQVSKFNHIVMTYTDGGSGSIAIYINGALAGSATPSAAVNTTGAEDLYVGSLKNYAGSYDFDGEVGQIRFYNSALTAAEVLQNFNATRALYAAHDGTASNITYTTGKFGKAASFNPSNTSHINIDSLDFPTNNFTVSVWVYLNYVTSSSGYDMILTTAKQNSGGYFYLTFSHNVLYYYETGAGAAVSANTTVVSNQWYHVVLTKSSTSGVKLYLNNVVVGSNSGYTSNNTPNTTSGGVNTIGWYNTGSSTTASFDGLMDQFRIFDKALSVPEINILYNETTTSAASATIDNPSTLAYYKMADATDETGNYDGTATNVDFNVQGKYGFAGKFNGTSSYIDLPANLAPAIRSVAAFSVSLWFQRNGNQPNSYGGRLMQILNDIYIVINLETNNTVKGLVVTSSTTYPETVTGVVPDNAWNHIVFTGDSNGIKLYLNGSLADSDNWDGTFMTYTNANYKFNRIGYSGSSVAYFKGKIDQVRIFNKAISATEVTKLYNEIQCANTISTPESYFDTKLYTGTGNSGLQVSGLSFQPDFTWIKVRNNSSWNHLLIDSVRGFASDGDAKIVSSNSTEVEFERASISSFNTNGFTLGDYGGSNESSSYNYVSWNWKSGGITHKAAFFPGNASIPTSAYLGSNWNSVPFSISFWAKSNSAADLYAMGTGNATGWAISFRNTSPKYVYMISGNNCKITYTIGEWKHFLYTFDGSSTIKGYGNSILEDTRAPHSSFGSTSPITIGKYGLAGSNFNGEIAQVRLFNKELTQSEINTVYAETASTLNTLQILGDTSCVATWPLGTNADDLSDNYSGTSSTNVRFGVPGFLMRNTNGTITSTVNASPESGFSIVKYTGNGTAGATVGHGLNNSPDLIIVKLLDTTKNWYVFSELLGQSGGEYQYLELNTTDSATTFNTQQVWNGVLPTSDVFTLTGGSAENLNNNDYIAYCFANVDGYQRIGSYVGNGSANGPFIYTGFEPAWLLLKSVDSSGTNWRIIDNKRDTTNPRANYLNADSSGTEETVYDQVNFLTNGFQLATTDTSINKNNDTVLFLAIAANPDTTEPTKANSFKTKLYTGDGNSTQSITGVGFKPDFTWLKNRTSSGENHGAYDSVRGNGYTLYPNLPNAQNTGNLLTLNSDGFTLNTTNNNINNHNYVSWNWKALDHDRNLPAINNYGSIPSVVSANPQAGFSIVKYFGNTTAGATVGHGLSAKPEWIFIKNLDQSVAWMAYDTNINSVGYLNLNDDFQTGRLAWAFNSTAPTTKTVTLGYNGGTAVNSSDNFIMYLWHSVAGHSKIGSYTISSSSDRIITGLGFTPSWVMIKRTDALGNWVIFDSARGDDDDYLYANTNAAEGTTGFGFTLDTDGFTVGTATWIGGTGGTYIYMAFK